MLAVLCVLLVLCSSAPSAGVAPEDAPGQRDLVNRAETVLTALVRLTSTDTVAAPWRWPVPGQHVVRPFDPPRSRWGAGHRGIDVAAWAGAEVTAVDDGVVSFSGIIAGVGTVSVLHSDGLRSTYQPVEDRAAQGLRVRQGDSLGTLAPTGDHCVVLTCLHLGALRGRDHYLDPLSLLRGWRLALLPLRESSR